MIPIPAVAAIVVVLYILSSIKIQREYERGVILRLGRLLPYAKGPGVILMFASVAEQGRGLPPQAVFFACLAFRLAHLAL